MSEIQCPRCPATFPASFAALAAQHERDHARQVRDFYAAQTADAIARAAFGRPRGTKYAQAEMFTYSAGKPVVQAELF